MNKEKLTRVQQNSLHLWLEQISELLIAKGITITDIVEQVSSKGIEIYPTKEGLKEVLVRPLINKMFGEISTKELEKTKQIDKLVHVITKFFGEWAELEIPPFPSEETIMFKQLENNEAE